jgi:hypothetical protein
MMPVHHYGIYWSLLIGLITGGGGVRFLVYVSQAMPPLKPNAGWWVQFFYNLLKNTSGLDPSSAILPQHLVQTLKETGTLPPDSVR